MSGYEVPAELPGVRRSLLLGFHAELCLRSSGSPAEHRPPGGSEGRLPAACWRALAVVDDRAGDLDAIVVHLDERASEIRRRTEQREARRASLEEALGLIPPAIEGEVARQ